MDPLLPLSLIVFTALMAETTVGFGATVVAVALGAFLLPLDALLAAFLPCNMVMSTYLVTRYARSPDLRLLLLRIVPLMAAGLVLGRLLTRAADPGEMKVVFGVFVVAVSARELWKLARSPAARRRLPGLVSGGLLLAGGVVHGLFATGGPMAVYVAGRQIEDKGVFRATLAGLWLLLNALLLIDFAASGTLGWESARTTAVLLVPTLAGLAAGEWLHRRVPARLFSGLLFSLLLLAGLLLATGA